MVMNGGWFIIAIPTLFMVNHGYDNDMVHTHTPKSAFHRAYIQASFFRWDPVIWVDINPSPVARIFELGKWGSDLAPTKEAIDWSSRSIRPI